MHANVRIFLPSASEIEHSHGSTAKSREKINEPNQTNPMKKESILKFAAAGIQGLDTVTGGGGCYTPPPCGCPPPPCKNKSGSKNKRKSSKSRKSNKSNKCR